MKKLLKLIGADGLLHLLVCYAMMLTFTPIVGLWWTLVIVVVSALLKEAWDFFIEKDNDKQAVIHDLICDAAGVLIALITMLIWKL